MTLRYKVFLLVGCAGLLIVGVTGGFTWSKLSRDSLDSIRADLERQLVHLDYSLTNFFREAENDVNALAASELVRTRDDKHFTSFLDADETTFEYNYSQVELDIINVLNGLRITHPYVNSVYMGRENGSFVRSHQRAAPTQYDPRKRPWYVLAKENPGRVMRTAPYQSVTTTDVNIGIVTALVDENDRVVGVVGADITLVNLTDYISGFDIGYTGQLLLLDEHGTILASRDADLLFGDIQNLLGDTAHELMNQAQGTVAFEDSQIFFMTSPALGWKFAAIIPDAFMVRAVWNSLVSPLTSLLLGGLLLSGLTIYGLSTLVIKPLEVLNDATKNIAQTGDLTHLVPLPQKDEIGSLSRSFNQMLQVLEDKKAALDESEKKYRDLVDNAVVGVFTTTLDGRFVFANQSLATLLEFDSGEELMAEGSFPRWKDPERRKQMLAELMAHGSVTSFEFEAITHNGRIIHALFSATFSDNLIAGMLMDITERKQAEVEILKLNEELEDRVKQRTAELAQASERLELATRAANLGIWDWDVKENALVWDDALYALYGITRDDFSDAYQAWTQQLHLDDKEEAERAAQAALQGEGDFNTEFRVVWPDGTVRHIRVIAAVQRDSDGEAVRMIGVNWDITERKASEEALKQSEEKFRVLYNNSPDMYVSVSPDDASILLCNETLLKKTGYSRDEIIGSPIFKMYHDDCMDEVKKAFQQFVETGVIHDKGLILKRKDGSKINVRLDVNVVKDDTGKMLYSISSWRDITDRKEAEEALKQSEEKYRAIVRDQTEFLVRYLPDTTRTFVNESYCRKWGRPADDLLGRRIIDELPEAEGHRLRGTIASLAPADPVVSDEYRTIASDGEERWERWTNRGIFNEDGELLEAQSVGWDITQSKLNELEMRLQNAALEAAANAIVVTNREGDIFYVNPAFTQLTGCEREEAIGQNPRLLKSDQQDEGYYQKLWDRILSGQTWQGQLVNKRKDGSFYDEEMAITPIFDRDGQITHFVAIKQDITERKRAEEELEKAKAGAEAANQAKSAFLTNMSHEIRTPMNAILGFTQLMYRDPTISPKQRETLGIINRSGRHLLELINDILDLSRIEAGRTTLAENSFDLHASLDTLEEMFRQRAEQKRLNLIFERAPNVPQFISADEQKLCQILINLLGNAVKFTDEGEIALQVKSDNSKLFIHVTDTGSGIAPEEMDMLFEAFTQTESGRKAQQGTGLGLAISQRFVHMMGGHLTVSSQLGQGSTFKFDIPVKLGQAIDTKPSQPARRVSGLEPGQPDYRILVVDDRMSNRVLIRQLLEEVGFKVQAAVDGQQAVQLSETWQPHLIWMDLRMPVLDGYQATRQIKATITDQTPVIIALTATAFEEDKPAVFAAGFDDYVRKPFRAEDIFDTMAEHLGLEFIYQDLSEVKDLGDTQLHAEPDSADLVDLPADWVTQMRQAATRGEKQRVLDLVEQIREDHTALAKGLAALANDFRFDRLVTLTEEGALND
jgi:two-component system sensor histidine kinase/response regulator